MQRLEWRQPTPLMQLRSFCMRFEGLSELLLDQSLKDDEKKEVKDAIRKLSLEFVELLPYVEANGYYSCFPIEWVDINSLKVGKECPICHKGKLARTDIDKRLICDTCLTDFSPR